MNSDIVQVNNSPLFDDIKHTQGGNEHLMQYLWDLYCKHLESEIANRTAQGKTAVSLEVAKKRAPATHFASWCADHLKENRPVESFFIDGNLGVRLQNWKCVAVSPGVVIQGSMQDSTSVEVTKGRSQEGMEGVVPSTNLRI